MGLAVPLAIGLNGARTLAAVGRGGTRGRGAGLGLGLGRL
ncbi:hypothetical protein C8N38_10946 [Rhodovulum kholense]|uniref:Uncharacterized protein n=1 Tax=Rhodovulum kholense TaxID=453584 RepID=A0A8E2VKN3_9RHOB|nr:hypothetical protein C8N38_10946 [Rhodovulum kholense]